MKTKLITLLLIVFQLNMFSQETNEPSKPSQTQNDPESDSEKLKKIVAILEKKKLIQIGLSVGYRRAFSIGHADKFLAEASISPMDTTLQVELGNRHSFLLSAIVSVYPFENRERDYKINDTDIFSHKRIGCYANINLLELSGDGDFSSIFNKKIEGGLGLAYKLSEAFSIGAGYEFIFHRRLRDYVINYYGGRKVYENGQVVTTLNKENDNLFRDDNVDAWSIKFIFYF